ncbi:MBG domain-containing protein, partial [Secundilactobacillus silagincola]|uniref:MBG domain-containing protein n=1 Tax=Secundilactobacillus silagincola TaxID=1714681 RepID=UPI0015D4F15A
MTKRQKALLNDATIQHKEHYKMYKSGGAWTFACIFLMSGLFWAAPTVTAKAAGTAINTSKSALANTSSQSSADGSTSQQNATTGATNGATTKAETVQTSTTGTAGTIQATPAVKAAATTPSTTTPTSSDGSTITGITTASLNGTNPANLNADGTISKADKTDVTTSSVQAVKDNFKAEQIVKAKDSNGKSTINPKDVSNTIANGGVTLVPANSNNTAGTLVFKNQIDTSQPFTFNATFTSQATGGGGGIGFILQPVDPQDAGVGEGSDPSADIGIYGQPNTTFIGRDGYIDDALDAQKNHVKADTDWKSLTIRQTSADSTGVLTSTTPTWATSLYSQSVPLTEYATLKWAPISGIVDQKVSGTLTYTTYSDAARTKQVQTLSTTSSTYIPTTKISSITLNQSVSIAAFGATGNELDMRSVQVADPKNTADVGGFTAKVNTMPIKITYVDQKGAVIHAADTTNVNVGDSLTIAPTTDLSTNTFAPRPIDGYRFVKAVASDGSNAITVTNSVLNALTSNPNVNNITVYYTNQVSYTIQPVNAQGQDVAGLAPTQGTGTIGNSIAAPVYTGYTAGTPSIKLSNTDGSIVPVTYTANQGSISVSYVGLPANLTPANGTFNGPVGSTYEIDSPTIAGYTSDQAAISGTVSKTGDTSFTVTYTASNNSYQIIPVDASGKVIAALTAMTETSTTGSKIVTPTYAGYTLDSTQTLSMTQSGVSSYQVKYNATPYTVTVTYIGLPTALKSGTATGAIGTGYQINSPIVAGYTADKTAVIGTFSGNTPITVTYTADTKVYKVQAVDASGVPIATLVPQQYSGQTGKPIQETTYKGYTAQESKETVPAESSPVPVINVVYTANKSTATVTYTGLPTDLTPADQVSTGVTDGTYQVVTPTVAGYTPDKAIVTGTYSNSGNSTQTVTYTANNNSYTVTPVDTDGNPIAGLSTTSETTPTNAKITIPDYINQGYEPIAGQTQVTQPGVTNYQVKYSAEKQTVNVTYAGLQTAAETPASQSQTGTLGGTYNFVSPTITGYTPDHAVINGTYTKGGNTDFTVTYAANPETVTITAAGLDPTTAAKYSVQTKPGKYGDSFTITATTIPGYTPDKTTITGTYSADSSSNMYVVTYTGQPASVTINYTGAGTNANPKSVTLTGIVGGSYSQLTPSVPNYTPDQATVAGMFTATDLTSKNMTVTVKYSPSKNAYTVEPVDADKKPISGLKSTLVVAVKGQITLPDYSSQGYVHVVTNAQGQYVVASQSDNIITAPASNQELIQETYQKQVSYTVSPVDDGNAINTLASVTAIGLVGQVVIPPVEPGYELVDSSTKHLVQDTDSAGKSDIIDIAYQAKPVTVTVVPVDGNGQAINGLQTTVVTDDGKTPRGGTSFTVSAPTYEDEGYQPALSDTLNITVPISDNGYTVQVPYLKMFTTGLTGTESETYNGATQIIDPDDYTVKLPDGTNYSLTVNDLQLVSDDASNPVDSTSTGATDAGSYKVELTASAKQAIQNSLSKNYAVTIDDSTGTFTITKVALTQPAANTAKVPVNVASPDENPQLATSIVVQGATKVYDGDASKDPKTFNVLVPSQYKDFKLSTLDASDFDLSSINQDAGSYQVTLNDQGIQALQADNPNYQFDAADVQNGLFVITKAPVAITVSDSAKVYDGTTNVGATQIEVTSPEGVTIPTLTTDDFDLSGITSANVGSYAVTLNQAGIEALQGANKNYTITSSNVAAGNLT